MIATNIVELLKDNKFQSVFYRFLLFFLLQIFQALRKVSFILLLDFCAFICLL